MNTRYVVRLENNTVGTIEGDTLNYQSAEDFIGETVAVKLHDENGFPVCVVGKLAEVLEVEKY